MARRPSPWYWPERRGWYTILNGQRHRLLDLAPEEPEPKKRAGKWVVPYSVEQLFHQLLAKPPEVLATPATNIESSGLTVAEVLDKHLQWCKQHREPRTYEWYHDHCQNFINYNPDVARLAATDLKPFHVIEWCDSHGDKWSNAYRRGAIIAIQRPFNFAEEMGYIAASPIKRIPKPTPQRREQFVSPAEWDKIKNHYADGDPFRDMLEFGWETGCRPQEVKRLEARHVDLAHHCVLFAAPEAKGKKHPRAIRMTPRAEEIIKRHLEQFPEGILFRNEDGQPWTAQAMACRFGRLKKHLGTKYAAYDLRHGFCQDMLELGNDPITVAELMGHRDTRMISSVYSHMNQAETHLQRALQRRANGNDQGISR
jgi:integrase